MQLLPAFIQRAVVTYLYDEWRDMNMLSNIKFYLTGSYTPTLGEVGTLRLVAIKPCALSRICSSCSSTLEGGTCQRAIMGSYTPSL